jgi:hypothetical protein
MVILPEQSRSVESQSRWQSVASKVAVAVLPEPLIVRTWVLPLAQCDVLAVSWLLRRQTCACSVASDRAGYGNGSLSNRHGNTPFTVPSVAVMVTGLAVLATTAVMVPLSLVLLTVICGHP